MITFIKRESNGCNMKIKEYAIVGLAGLVGCASEEKPTSVSRSMEISSGHNVRLRSRSEAPRCESEEIKYAIELSGYQVEQGMLDIIKLATGVRVKGVKVRRGAEGYEFEGSGVYAPQHVVNSLCMADADGDKFVSSGEAASFLDQVCSLYQKK